MDFRVATKERAIKETQSEYFTAFALLIDDSRVDNFINVKAINTNQFAKEVRVFKRSPLALKFLNELIAENDADGFPQTIFLDLNMPIMTGPEFLDEFAKLPPKFTSRARIVILSNFINDQVSRELREKHDNIVRFIEKPLINSNLVDLRDNF